MIPYRYHVRSLWILVIACSAAQAQSGNLVSKRIQKGTCDFESAAPTVTFSGAPTNPRFEFTAVGPYASVTVSFGSLFSGQSLGSGPNALLEEDPSRPLVLSTSGPDVASLFDIASPTPPILGGFNGRTYFQSPLAFQFDQPMSAVSFDLGHLDAAGAARIQVYDADGNVLGTVLNSSTGFEHICIAAVDDEQRSANLISGVSVFLPEGAMDWEGFGLDNVRFGAIPEPASMGTWGLLGSLFISSRWRKKRCRASVRDGSTSGVD